MSKYTEEQVRQVVERSAVFSPGHDCGLPCAKEDVRLNYTTDIGFVGTGEASGEEYVVLFSEINLDSDVFYRLVPVEVSQVIAPTS